MERQEHLIGSFQIMPKFIGFWVVLAVLLLLSVSGWAACSYNSSGNIPYSGNSNPYCKGDPSWGASFPLCSTTPACAGGVIQSSNYYYVDCWVNYSGRNLCLNGSWGTVYAEYRDVRCRYRCSSLRDADSTQCALDGKFWNSSNGTCSESCPQCDAFESACESESGVFSGTCLTSGGSTCCQGVCDVCSGEAMEKLYKMKVNQCCEQGLAPPNKANVCTTQGIGTGCGVQWSQYQDLSSGEWACQSPGLSVDAATRYRELCFNEEFSSSAAESSPSSAGSSSGEGTSSGGSPYPEGCDECPWLDSILDTLTLQKHIVENIESCIKYPALCGSEESTEISIDTSILPYLRPYLDSTIQLDKQQLEVLSKLDTNLLKILDTLSKLPKSDTALMLAVNAASSNIEGKLNTVNTSVVNMNDSTKKWLRRIADSIGVSTDSLIIHLDSIKNRIPKDVLDSINKYQKLLYEKEITVDLDNDVNDSLGSLHTAIDDISYTMYWLLGYGDTASKSLRNDLESITGAVNEYRDSALKYYASFGDSMGALNSSLGALIAKFSPGAVDTTGLGVWASYMRSGENMGDSIVNSYGWQNLKNLNVDSNYSAALGGLSNKTDSISAVVDDSLSNKAARLNDSLIRKNDSLKRSLPDTLTKYADSLVIWAPFADFDSIIYSTIGTRIPDRDECPEDCQKWSVSIPIIGLVNYTVDYGLCLGRASLGNLSVLAFLKLLIRIIVAITCVMIIYRTLIGLK